jgi:hypothetical protein
MSEASRVVDKGRTARKRCRRQYVRQFNRGAMIPGRGRSEGENKEQRALVVRGNGS